ncbi:hypothetical protein HELRODRAFT_175845 [Helobdella robusta]|uniref:Endonuclease/exonuclease/phosphatase domain-containing protein n=1 Tax=Helobdella robusta TaxID=6412 RepID=T1F9R7_HELRO|nr:hypothetical protein HELRODRAFT_175845 [Helobdella robusta]ESO00424.1 hypothetical protein HELRODRAFT_175845 [Helobdella robusta]
MILVLKAFMKLRGFKYIAGDFNFPRIDWGTLSINSESKSIEKIFVNLVKNLFLHQVVQEHTRFRSLQANHILDLILVKELDEIKNLVHLPPLGKNDHCILCFEVGLTIDGAHKIIDKTRLNFNKGDEQDLTGAETVTTCKAVKQKLNK